MDNVLVPDWEKFQDCDCCYAADITCPHCFEEGKIFYNTKEKAFVAPVVGDDFMESFIEFVPKAYVWYCGHYVEATLPESD